MKNYWMHLNLKHDMDCENLIVLNNPVAVDLRFVLAVLKINYNLERIGDYANYIANTDQKIRCAIRKPVAERYPYLRNVRYFTYYAGPGL